MALAAPGLQVGITWHEDREGAESTAREVEAAGATAHVRQLDLTEPRTGATLVDELAETMGGVDTVVLNAGTGSATRLLISRGRRPRTRAGR